MVEDPSTSDPQTSVDNLFQYGIFDLTTAGPNDFKIECDALTDGDWETLAYLMAKRLPPFGWVIGVPRGGLKLAECLKPYRTHGGMHLLIVDDVYTTGESLRSLRIAIDSHLPAYWPVIGAVVFARTRPHPDVYALFQLSAEWHEK